MEFEGGKSLDLFLSQVWMGKKSEEKADLVGIR